MKVALEEGIKRKGKKPGIIYSDDDGSLTSPEMKEWFESKNIRHISTKPTLISQNDSYAHLSLHFSKALITARLKTMFPGRISFMRFYSPTTTGTNILPLVSPLPMLRSSPMKQM